MVTRRGRWKKVCARVACPAWSSGPSTSPLERMRVVALVLVGVITGSVGAAEDGPDRWVEYSHVYATVANTGDGPIIVSIIVHADEALEPLGFHRDSTRGEIRGMLLRGGAFASYKAGGLAVATIIPGSRPGCIVFSATNYDEHVAGLVKAAAAAIEARFRKLFGSSVTFFTDATCSHAL